MIGTVKSSNLLGDPRDDQRAPRKPSDQEPEAGEAPKAPPADASDRRLVIEADGRHGGLTYKMIDRATGEVVSAVSREDLMKISADPTYTAGKVIDTKA